ncbi:hypothetical protein QSE00_15445 [Arenibacter sp. M-2]|uniref:hypothetical protein n=1 Tax=Arenibacter sp. M-2 TaxID=3053612 RepID=UPI00256FCF6B|nr:hypothetical protein [Arenibacter sp. M-2]MDL5513219.1 hypothetical protein [Arenibacter sp. M-2]
MNHEYEYDNYKLDNKKSSNTQDRYLGVDLTRPDVEVSTKSDFSTTVSGYNKKEVSGISVAVSSLTTKTKCYVRVYTVKGTDVSKPSAVKEITTS